MATKKRKKKRGGGRHDHSGVYTGIKPGSEEWSDIRNKIIYGSAEWRTIRLQELNDGDKLPDNLLSARAAENQAKARTKGYVLLDEIDSLWNTLSAQFERAVLDGDAEWFDRQAKAIRWHDSRTESKKARAHFNAEVIRRLEGAFWSTHSKKGDNRESATLTPADKITDTKARKILDSFNQRADMKPLTPEEIQTIRDLEWSNFAHTVIEDEIGKGYKRDDNGDYIAVHDSGGALIVEWKDQTQKFRHRFKNQRCALDAIRDIANRLRLA
jgi:hypothetical protein